MARILLVDDEPDVRLVTRLMLEKAGHSVVEAGSGEECLEKLKAEAPDLILLDVRMPGIDGWDVCRRVKADKRTRSIPVVMFTVKTSKEDIQRSRECGAEAHINKPFEMEELLETVEMVLARYPRGA